MSPISRPQQWAKAAQAAESALQELVDLQESYQEWYDNMPEGLQQGATGEMLSAITELDLQGALDTVQEAAATDLPQGFGRD